MKAEIKGKSGCNIHSSCCMEAYRNYDEFSKCSRCKLKQFCRGCPAVAKGYTGDFYGDDPQCWACEENGLLTPKEERRAG